MIDLGAGAQKKVVSTSSRTIHLPSSTEQDRDEESVTAIKNFLDATANKEGAKEIAVGDDLKVPSGVKVTSAGKGSCEYQGDFRNFQNSLYPCSNDTKGSWRRILSASSPKKETLKPANAKTLVVASSTSSQNPP